MSIFNFNKDEEKEVSSGVLMGYVLIGFAVVVILAFGIFVVVKKTTGKKEEAPIAIEQTTDEEIEETPEN